MAATSRVDLGLEAVSAEAFELFAQVLLAQALGLGEFVPTGGTKDGGADGILGVLESRSAPTVFAQVSKQATTDRKIRQTLHRLKEVGRTVDRLVYVTHLDIAHPDLIAAPIEKDFAVRVDIRGASWIQTSIQADPQIRAAWSRFVEPSIQEVGSRIGPPVRTESKHVKRVDALVFMRQELDAAGGGRASDRVLDGLILWALEGTDPDEGILRDRPEIIDRIEDAFPGSRITQDLQRVQNRLDELASKLGGGRRIKHHVQEGAYCLPYETRQALEDREADDAAIEVRYRQSLMLRFADHSDDEAAVTSLCESATEVLQRTLEVEGTGFATFIMGSDPETQEGHGLSARTLEEVAEPILAQHDLTGATGLDPISALCDVLRDVVYYGSDVEREYLRRLAQTYTLFFLANEVPNVAEYFDDAKIEFDLVVGSDVLVRALSEEFLAEEHQSSRNLLRLLAGAGAELHLTEPVLNEVVNHLRTSDHEYKNHIAEVAHVVDHDLMRHSRKILIRALYWARRNINPGTSWESFVHRFVDYPLLHGGEAERQLRDYLCHEFGMDFVDDDQLTEIVSAERLDELIESFEFKKMHVLQRNDALIALYVARRRANNGELGARTEFGTRTWWLTDETRIRRVPMPQGGVVGDFAMRPGFVAQWLSVLPQVAPVRQRFRESFPTVHGLHISRRVSPEIFRECMKQARAALDLPPARRVAQMASLADELKKKSRMGPSPDETLDSDES